MSYFGDKEAQAKDLKAFYECGQQIKKLQCEKELIEERLVKFFQLFYGETEAKLKDFAVDADEYFGRFSFHESKFIKSGGNLEGDISLIKQDLVQFGYSGKQIGQILSLLCHRKTIVFGVEAVDDVDGDDFVNGANVVMGSGHRAVYKGNEVDR